MIAMLPVQTMVGAVLWALSSLLGLGAIVGYMMWRSWQSAHHTKQTAQGRQPTAAGEGDAKEIHS